MPPLDIANWLEPVAEDSPAGPNLEFDADFSALERAAQGKPEQQYGDTVIAGEEPDWKDVQTLAFALLERSRDLRVLGHLAVARLHLAGLPDYAEILSLVRQLLEIRWDEVHPQLDPEDDNDPTLRANALLQLAHPGLVLKSLRSLPLANSPRLGRYSWRDIALATGLVPSETDDKPNEAVIRSAFQDSSAEQLAALRQVAETAAQEARGICNAFDARAGAGNGPDFDDLIKLLTQMAQFIQRYAIMPDAEAPSAELADAATEAEPDMPAPAGVVHRPAFVTAAALTEVNTRAEAMRLLDLVSQYYQRNEPSSPLPFLLDRARRLADKNFLDILRDMAPDGLQQAQNVVGSSDE